MAGAYNLKIVCDNDTIDNSKLRSAFSFENVLMASDTFTVGECNANSFKISVVNEGKSYSGKQIDVSYEKNGVNSKLGSFTVYEDVLSSNRKIRDIVAYDKLYEMAKTDVITWYNSFFQTYNNPTLLDFRNSLFEEVGIEQELASLPNDSIPIEKTIEASELFALDVMKKICEVNACFGKINATGKFEYIIIDMDASAKTISISEIKSVEYSDYTVAKVNKLQIRKEDNDIGVIVGTGKNCYVIQDNFLLYGKSASELRTIGTTILERFKTITYRPVKLSVQERLDISVGSNLSIQTKEKVLTTIALQQTLTGKSVVNNEIVSSGKKNQEESQNKTHQIINELRGKTNVLRRTIDELSSTITDVEQGLSSSIEQTANGLKVEITRATDAENVLSSRIEATENRITLEVSNLRTEIDGEFQTYNIDYEPTLLNFPAWDWTYNIPCNGTVLCNGVKPKYTDEGYKKNARTIAFNTVTSVSYRFTKNDDTKEWYWKEIANSEYANVLQQLSELKIELGKITTTVSENRTYSDERFEELSSKITQTATSITAEVTRASSEEGKLSSRITQTAESITTEVNRATTAEGQLSSKITQTAESITAEVTRATTEEGKLSSKITQTAEKITLEVNRATTAEGQLSSKITQTADKIELEVTRATNAEGTLSSKLQLQANEISARVTKTGGDKETFGWSLTSRAFKLFSGNSTVFNCNKDGITVKGYTKTDVFEAANARIKSLEADHVSVSSLNAVSAKVTSLEADHVTVKNFNALNATVSTIKANYITANSITAELIQSKFQSPSAGAMTMGTIRAANIQKYDGSNYVSFVMRTATIGGVTLKYVGW